MKRFVIHGHRLGSIDLNQRSNLLLRRFALTFHLKIRQPALLKVMLHTGEFPIACYLNTSSVSEYSTVVRKRTLHHLSAGVRQFVYFKNQVDAHYNLRTFINSLSSAENSEPEPDHTKEAMVCQSPAVDTVSFEVSLDSPITQEDIVKFMKFNIENGLSSGQVPLAINEAIKWRQTVIDLLFQIGKKSISTEYVDHGLLNVAKIINLLYQNALHAKKLIDNDNEIEWMTVYIPRLASCSDQLGPLPLSGRGFQVGLSRVTMAPFKSPLRIP